MGKILARGGHSLGSRRVSPAAAGGVPGGARPASTLAVAAAALTSLAAATLAPSTVIAATSIAARAHAALLAHLWANGLAVVQPWPVGAQRSAERWRHARVAS